jgi:hypothetical protein
MKNLFLIIYVAATLSFTVCSAQAQQSPPSQTNAIISLTGNSATINGPAGSAGTGATVNGSTVNINSGGNYTIRGISSNGQILVSTSEEVAIILDGADITNNSGAAIYSVSSRLVITLAVNSVNRLVDGRRNFARTGEPNAALFSHNNLTINGSGSLTVTAENNTGIQSHGTLTINGGVYNITTGGGFPGGSLRRGSHTRSDEWVVIRTKPAEGNYRGIQASQINISGGYITVSAYDDAIQSRGNININGGTFALQTGENAILADNTITINDGNINIQNSFEGIEAAFINLNGGIIRVRSTDDGINIYSLTGLLTISGGDIYVNAEGDGIDSNRDMLMTGGTVRIDGPAVSNNGAVDVDGRFNIRGGTLIGVDAQMSQAPDTTSTQPSIQIRFNRMQSAGTEFSLRSPDGRILLQFTPLKQYRNIVLSSPDLQRNSTYSFYLDNIKLSDIMLTSSVTRISL